MAYLSVPKISRHLIFLHLSSPFIVDNCSYISILSFAITYIIGNFIHMAVRTGYVWYCKYSVRTKYIEPAVSD